MPDKAARVADQFLQSTSVAVAPDLREACVAADIIVTVTSATTPLIKRDWVQPGTHITAVGADAPGKQELESALVAAADGLFADLSAQCLDHGEIALPYRDGLITTDRVADLGDVLIDPARGRKTESEITIADLTGLAAQDIAMAQIVFAASEGV